MGTSILHPIIIKLYLLRTELAFLEDILNLSDNSDEWPEHYYDDILLMTDRFYRVHNKSVKMFNSAENVDYLMFLFEKQKGSA
jgi:hypothetical protein